MRVFTRLHFLNLLLLSAVTSGCNRNEATQNQVVADDHKADEARLAELFPGAKLSEKAMLFDGDKLKALGVKNGATFSGTETEWEMFEATKKGTPVGTVMLCHADTAKDVEIHIGFSVDPHSKVLQTIGLERTNQGFKRLVKQFRGKDFKSPFQMGKDLKEVADYPPQFSQAVASTVRKGLILLHEFQHPDGAGKK